MRTIDHSTETKMRESASEDVRVPAGGHTLAATLQRPTTAAPHPACLLLQGSGPLDRDGNVGKKMRLDISRRLADELAEAGWASVRFDKRGVGESTGEYLPTGFHDERTDAEAMLDWMIERDDISHVVIIGHSAGAVHAGELAARRGDLAGAVLLSTSLKTGEETMRWQNEQLDDVLLPGPVRALLRVFGTSLAKQSAKAVRKLKATTDDVVRMQLVAKVNAKWMREFIDHDPAPAIADARVPLLAITGSKDIQVDPADLEALVRIAPPGTEAHVIDDVDHILRHEPGDVSNPRKYKARARNDLDPRVAHTILGWLGRL